MSQPTEVPAILHSTRWLKLLQRGKWVYASRREPGAPFTIDALNIIAWHDDETGYRRLVVIDEFRHPINRWEYSFPAGLIEAGETLQTCAARELAEETGFIAYDFGAGSTTPLFSSAGMSDEAHALLNVFCRGQPAANPGIGGEQIKVLLLDQAASVGLLKTAGQEQHAISARLWPILMSLATTGGFCGIQLGPVQA